MEREICNSILLGVGALQNDNDYNHHDRTSAASDTGHTTCRTHSCKDNTSYAHVTAELFRPRYHGFDMQDDDKNRTSDTIERARAIRARFHKKETVDSVHTCMFVPEEEYHACSKDDSKTQSPKEWKKGNSKRLKKWRKAGLAIRDVVKKANQLHTSKSNKQEKEQENDTLDEFLNSHEGARERCPRTKVPDSAASTVSKVCVHSKTQPRISIKERIQQITSKVTKPHVESVKTSKIFNSKSRNRRRSSHLMNENSSSEENLELGPSALVVSHNKHSESNLQHNDASCLPFRHVSTTSTCDNPLNASDFTDRFPMARNPTWQYNHGTQVTSRASCRETPNFRLESDNEDAFTRCKAPSKQLHDTEYLDTFHSVDNLRSAHKFTADDEETSWLSDDASNLDLQKLLEERPLFPSDEEKVTTDKVSTSNNTSSSDDLDLVQLRDLYIDQISDAEHDRNLYLLPEDMDQLPSSIWDGDMRGDNSDHAHHNNHPITACAPAYGDILDDDDEGSDDGEGDQADDELECECAVCQRRAFRRMPVMETSVSNSEIADMQFDSFSSSPSDLEVHALPTGLRRVNLDSISTAPHGVDIDSLTTGPHGVHLDSISTGPHGVHLDSISAGPHEVELDSLSSGPHGIDIDDLLPLPYHTLVTAVGHGSTWQQILEALLQTLITQMLAVNPDLLDQAPPPADEDVISALPKYHLTQQHIDDEVTCSICLCAFELEDGALELPCGHAFHDLCVQAWLKKSGTCPFCRRVISPSDQA